MLQQKLICEQQYMLSVPHLSIQMYQDFKVVGILISNTSQFDHTRCYWMSPNFMPTKQCLWWTHVGHKDHMNIFKQTVRERKVIVRIRSMFEGRQQDHTGSQVLNLINNIFILKYLVQCSY